MDLFDIAAKITLDTSDYEKDLAGAEGKGSGFADKLKKGLGTAAKVGTAAVAAVGAGVAALGTKFVSGLKNVASYGDEVDKMSQKLGLSTKAYQEWDYVLGMSGVDITNMSTGLKTLTNKMDDAKNGGEDAQKMFEALGISLDDLKSMSREDLFADVIAGFQGMEDSTERAALANDLFGKSGLELTPLFNSSIEETNQLRKAANDLGFVMSNYAVSSAAKFNDSLDTLTRTVGGIKNQFLQNFLPAASMVMDGLTAIFGGDSKSGIGMIETGIKRIVTQLSLKIPKFLDIGWGIVDALSTAITDNLPMLIEKGADLLLNGVIPGLMEQLPTIIETAFAIVGQLVSSIGGALPKLIPAAVSMIIQIVESLLDNIDLLIDAAIQLIMGLIDGIMQAIPLLISKVPLIIEKFIAALIRNLPKIISMAPQIIMSLIKGIVSALPELIHMAPEIVLSIISGIVSAFGDLYGSGKEMLEKVKEGFASAIESAKNWGKDLIKNFSDGMMSKLNDLKEKVKKVANSIKSFLGFSEPEEGPLSDFHTYAPDMMNLFMKGIEDNKRKLERTVADAFDFGGVVTDPNGWSGGSRPVAAGAGAGFSGTIDLYIDKRTLVGSTSKEMDRSLGDIDKIKSRYGGRN